MPHEITWEKDGVHKRFWGHLSGNELADSVETVAADPRFDEIRFILDDFLEVTSHALDTASMERITASLIGSRYVNPRIRMMRVTANESLFALSDVTKAGAFPPTNQTKGFGTVAEAKTWYFRQPLLIENRHQLV